MLRSDLQDGKARKAHLSVLYWLRRAGRGLLDLLYPPRCVACGQMGVLYCDVCRESVTRVTAPVCSLCGKSIPAPGLCSHCVNHPLDIDGIRSVAVFGGSLRKAIHHFKYRHSRHMAEPLGEMLVRFWQQTPLVAEAIVPVPLHSRRLRERGYNQSMLLAQQLEQAAGLPILSGVLHRTKYTVSQTHLDGDQRRQNVAGAFVCREGVKDKSVLLVDDVCTTGATLEASSMALKAGGAKSVWALTLARAQ